MAKQLSRTQIAETTKAFMLFDKKKRGYITAKDIQSVLKKRGENLSEQQVKQMVAEVDTKGNGRISMPGFMEMMSKFYSQDDSPDKDVKAKFSSFDIDNKGFVTAQDIMLHMAEDSQVITIKDAEGMIQYADTDGDGQLNYEEFKTLYQQIIKEDELNEEDEDKEETEA